MPRIVFNPDKSKMVVEELPEVDGEHVEDTDVVDAGNMLIEDDEGLAFFAVADQGEGLVLCELVPVEGTEFAEAPDLAAYIAEQGDEDDEDDEPEVTG
jgi:hypothetical protein